MLAQTNRPALGEPTSSAADTPPISPLLFACEYYGIGGPESIQLAPRQQDRPVITVLEDIFEVTRLALADGQFDEVRFAIAGRFLSTITSLVPTAGLSRNEPLAVPWDPAAWLSTMLDRLRSAVSVPREILTEAYLNSPGSLRSAFSAHSSRRR
jgi:hypothetical protein